MITRSQWKVFNVLYFIIIFHEIGDRSRWTFCSLNLMIIKKRSLVICFFFFSLFGSFPPILFIIQKKNFVKSYLGCPLNMKRRNYWHFFMAFNLEILRKICDTNQDIGKSVSDTLNTEIISMLNYGMNLFGFYGFIWIFFGFLFLWLMWLHINHQILLFL